MVDYFSWLNELRLEQLITVSTSSRTNIPVLSEMLCPCGLSLKIVPVRDLYSSFENQRAVLYLWLGVFTGTGQLCGVARLLLLTD